MFFILKLRKKTIQRTRRETIWRRITQREYYYT